MFVVLGGASIATPVHAGMCGCLCAGPGGSTAPGGPSCSNDLQCNYSACRTYCAGFGTFTPGTTSDGRRVYSCVGGVSLDDGLTQEEQQRIDETRVAPPTERRSTRSGGSTGASGGNAAPTGDAQTPPGDCSFSCGATGVTPQTAMVTVRCSTDQDCVTACTNRCPIHGPAEFNERGERTNGLPEGPVVLSCSQQPNPPRCIIRAGATAPAGATTSETAGEGGLRFVLPPCTENGNCSLTDIINTGIRAANFLLALSGLVFLATVLWAGAQLIFFAHDAKSFSKAQSMLTSASIAMIIIMVAGVAVRFVSSGLGVTPSLLQTPGRARPRTPGTTTPPATPAATPSSNNATGQAR